MTTKNHIILKALTPHHSPQIFTLITLLSSTLISVIVISDTLTDVKVEHSVQQIFETIFQELHTVKVYTTKKLFL